MLLSKKTKKPLLVMSNAFVLSIILLGGCKQNDFYEKSKAALEEEPAYFDGDPTTNSGTTNSGTTSSDTNSTVPPTTPVVEKIIDQTETFTQNVAKDGDLDILWVLDNSGSMADKQKALADNFATFIDHFANKDINFNMGMTTTDGRKIYNGVAINDFNKLSSAFLKNNKTAFINNFKNYANVGTNGSGKEQGLKCAKSFFDRYGSSFIRKDAYLIVVFLSDEEDQSELSKEDYLNALKALKPHEGMVKVYSIVTQKLTSSMREQTVGTRYNFVAENTNGIKADIYGDFYKTLDQMGETITNLLDSFALNATPVSGSIQVLVNNKEQKTGWSFDSVSKTIKFSASNIPLNGSSIVVKYKTVVK